MAINKELKSFEIRIEALVPTTLTYRVMAESPQQALDAIKNRPPTNIKPKLDARKVLKAAVYNSGTSMIVYTKTFGGK